MDTTEYPPAVLQALELCFKHHGSRRAVVSSHGGNDLRQLVMFVIDEVVEEDRRLLLACELESSTLQDRTSGSLSPAPPDVYVTLRTHAC